MDDLLALHAGAGGAPALAILLVSIVADIRVRGCAHPVDVRLLARGAQLHGESPTGATYRRALELVSQISVARARYAEAA